MIGCIGMIRFDEYIEFDIMNSDDCKGVVDEYEKRPHSETRTSRITHRVFIIHHLGAKCVLCSDNRVHHLEIDHIYNDGYADLKGVKLYKKLVIEINQGLDITQKFQVLCAGCNRKKHVENNHRKKSDHPLIEKIDKNTSVLP